MSTRSFSDVPNRIVNLYLQEAGWRYDRQRGRLPYNRMTPELRAYFGNGCAYCGSPATAEDHIVPRNRWHGGLHAWGNVVPVCVRCNNLKRCKSRGDHTSCDWERLVDQVAGSAAERRKAAVRRFIADYDYHPDTSKLAAILEALYVKADKFARTLVADAISGKLGLDGA